MVSYSLSFLPKTQIRRDFSLYKEICGYKKKKITKIHNKSSCIKSAEVSPVIKYTCLVNLKFILYNVRIFTPSIQEQIMIHTEIRFMKSSFKKAETFSNGQAK